MHGSIRSQFHDSYAFVVFTQKIAGTATHCSRYEFFPPNGRCFNEIIAWSCMKNLFFIGISACKPDESLLSLKRRLLTAISTIPIEFNQIKNRLSKLTQLQKDNLYAKLIDFA